MPNWTTNKLTFNNAADAERVWEGMQYTVLKCKEDSMGNIVGEPYEEKVFSFEAIVPKPKTKKECPEHFLLKENDRILPNSLKPWLNWYAWNTSKWGVKWDASDAALDENIIWFSTPWSKPFNSIFQGIADKFEVSFFHAADNEDGGWEEIDYFYSPRSEMTYGNSEWQVMENVLRYEDEDLDEEYSTATEAL